MSFESPYIPPIPPEEKKPEKEEGLLPPLPETLGPGPEAPGLAYKEKPILPDVKEEPRIGFPAAQERHKTPEEIKDERYMAIIKELEDEWMKRTGGYIERSLSVKEVEERKRMAEAMGEKWDGKTTVLTDAFSDFYFAFGGGESVPAKAKKILAERFPEYAEKKAEDEKIQPIPQKTPEEDQTGFEKNIADASQKHVEAPANLPTEESSDALQPEASKSEGKIKIPVEGGDVEAAQPQEVPLRHVEKKEKRVAGAVRDALGIDHMAGAAKLSAEMLGEDALEFGKKSVEAMRRKLGVDDMIDSAKMSFNGMIAGWFGRREAGAKDRLRQLTDGLKSLENDSAHIERQLKIFRSAGEVSEKDLLKMEADKQKLEAKIGAARQRVALQEAGASSVEISRKTFENRRDEACRTYQERAQAELDPFEDKIYELTRTRGQLDKEIAADSASLRRYNDRLAALQEEMGTERFSSVRKAMRETIKHVSAEAKWFEREIHDREKHRLAIDKQIAKAEKRALPFRGKVDEMERIMRGADASAPAAERPSRGRAIVGVGGMARTEAATGIEGQPASADPEAEEIYSDDELVEAWNEINGSKMTIHPKAFKEALEPARGKKKGAAASVDGFWSEAQIYSAEHGDSERMEGMPSVEKAAAKKRGFWKFLFGLPDAKMGKKRLLEALKRNRSKKEAFNKKKP
ncbi:MAG: hypothetical protein KGI69_02055 [Patescibacteria group bacterium]|nr:hypothetical protein [Patescibacteria group bacterium]